MKDINSYEYFQEMTDVWTREDFSLRCYDLCKELIELRTANEYLQNLVYELQHIKQPNYYYSDNVRLRAENKKLIDTIDKALKILNTPEIAGSLLMCIDQVRYILEKGSEK